MKKHNPIIIPRNYLVEEALEEAGNGNINSFQKLLQIISTPYKQKDDLDKFMKPPAGITSLESETEGTMGMIKKTSINFIVHNSSLL